MPKMQGKNGFPFMAIQLAKDVPKMQNASNA
jgi:hypothetical protein